MKHLIVIPTRLASTRFPNKPFAKIKGKEMILHVAKRASEAGDVIIATPDKEIVKLVNSKGYKAFLTQNECLTGTDRVCEVAEVYPEYDIFVNVQGDEPLIDPADIINIVILKKIYYNYIINGIGKNTDIEPNPNTVKVIQYNHTVLDMTRKGNLSEFKQCGLYAFNKEELARYKNLKNKKEALEEAENIEIMLFSKYLGIGIKTIGINQTQSVDVVGDIEKIKKILEGMKNARRT